MSKAIIATPTDGTKEVLRNEENGLLIPVNDISALTDAILRLHDDYSLMEKCRTNARMFVSERFNANRVAESVSTIYSKYK